MGALITICSLLLFAYVFDIFSSKIKIPTVIILLLTGWLSQIIISGLDIKTPDLSDLLTPLGTLGLILIVLEGSLELEINRSKIPLIFKSGIGALGSIVLFNFIVSFLLIQFYDVSIHKALINAIPFSIISSAIAIPSSRSLPYSSREFIIYESSLSDIIGVVLFTFVTTYYTFHASIIGVFILQTILMLVISLAFSVLLVFLMKKVKHKVKFLPIVIFIILIYSIAKELHLPALIFILIFGLLLKNIQKLEKISFLKRFDFSSLDKEISKFNDLVYEMTFLIRVLFFILFGFLLSTNDIINTNSLYWSLPITVIIFLIRYIQLKATKEKIDPLLFIAPRGLITILLFLSIPASDLIPAINKSVITQVILLTSFVIMIATFKKQTTTQETEKQN